jgi:hypothetical protein
LLSSTNPVGANARLSSGQLVVGIAVWEVAGPNGSRRIRQVKNMQLYNVRELEDVITGILERMQRDVARGQ